MSYDDLRVSQDIRLGELTVSAEHPELVQPIPPEHQPNACRLIVTCLQPLRDWTARPIKVLSGYRTRQLNSAVGGTATSQHLGAAAADITSIFVRMIFEGLLTGKVRIPCGQTIYYPARQFIHLALPSIRYALPTFCLHDPDRGWNYRPLDGVRELRELLA